MTIKNDQITINIDEIIIKIDGITIKSNGMTIKTNQNGQTSKAKNERSEPDRLKIEKNKINAPIIFANLISISTINPANMKISTRSIKLWHNFAKSATRV